MIYTVTLNPCVDYFITVNDFNLGSTNFSNNEYKSAGGKGINVSTVLSNLGNKSLALGFIGGLEGIFIENTLKKNNIATDFITLSGKDTRINVKMICKSSNIETEINGSSPHITSENLSELMSKISLLKEGDILVLSGSVPNSLSKTVYKDIMDFVNPLVKVIVDTSGIPLLEAIKHNPFLIKPNKKELEYIFDKKINSIEDTIYLCKKMLQLGAKNIIVSLDKDGGVLATNNKFYLAKPPKGDLVNSVGAGDSLVAGFVYSLSQKKSILDCFKYGIASGSASAFSKNLCSKKNVEVLVDKVEVTTLC